MYVDPFWVGVFATILSEVIALIVLALYLGGKK